MRQKLTDLAIRKLPFPPKGSTKHWDISTPGFGVRCTANTKSFIVMYGNDRRLKTIGRYPDMTLSEARRTAMRVISGSHPSTSIKTLREASEAFLEDCGDRLRPKSVAAYATILKNAPDLKLQNVSTKNVPTKTAHEIKTYKALFNWLIRNEIVQRNPFLHLTPTFTKRERTLTDDEISALWSYEHRPYTDIIKLLLLTGQRRSQIWRLQPEWVDGDVINFSADIMKGGKPHSIPFGSLTKQYLSTAPFSFNGWSKAKVRLDRHLDIPEWTVHDLRRTFATIHARLGTPIHVVEAHLAHTSGTISGVAAVYIRHNWMEEMRKAQETYEAHIAKITAP